MNKVPDVHVKNTGEYDFDQVTYFVNDLLDRGYIVELEFVGSCYELKGYKKKEDL